MAPLPEIFFIFWSFHFLSLILGTFKKPAQSGRLINASQIKKLQVRAIGWFESNDSGLRESELRTASILIILIIMIMYCQVYT